MSLRVQESKNDTAFDVTFSVFQSISSILHPPLSSGTAMPTYDYSCDACDHTWEEFQSIKADPTKKCPSCGKSILFKGSGFYITDYRSDSYKKSADADKKTSSGGEAKSESKSDPSPKPAATKTDK
jgi:putative FmdB family regulatory protein